MLMEQKFNGNHGKEELKRQLLQAQSELQAALGKQVYHQVWAEAAMEECRTWAELVGYLTAKVEDSDAEEPP